MNAKPEQAEPGGSLILWFDIIREARRGRTTLVRVLYIVTLFLTLLIPYYVTSRDNPDHAKLQLRGLPNVQLRPLDDTLNYRARLATNFTVTILITQWLAALVLMPMYAVSTLHADRDNGTLELLLTTPVNGPQIINAKMWACFINVGGVLLGGVPLMAIIQIWGGVDSLLVAQNVITTSAAMLAVCSLSFHVALRSNGAMLAVGRVYGLLLLFHTTYGLLSSVLLTELTGPFSSLGEQLNVLGFLGGTYSMGWIFFQLRNGRFLETLRSNMPTLRSPEFSHKNTVPGHASLKPDIGENALIWKERLEHNRMSPELSALIIVALSFTALFTLGVFVADLMDQEPVPDELQRERGMVVLTVMVACIVVVGATLSNRLACTVVSERERQTLDALFLLPGARSEILFAKLVGIVTSEKSRLALLGIVYALLWLISPFHLFASLGLVLAIIAQLFFYAALSLYLSVVCRTTVQAYVTHIVISLTLLVVPIAIPFIAGIEPGRWLGFHPLASLFILGQCWWSNDLARMAAFLWPQAIYLAAGVVLAISAWRRFCVC